jgi:uncharacterized membrane protein YtjA (UPF0391 family)
MDEALGFHGLGSPMNGLNNLIIRLLLSLFVVVLTTAKGRVKSEFQFRESVIAL